MSSVNFDPAVGGDGSTVSDDANATTGLANGGHRTRFVPALSQIVAVAQWVLAKANQVSTWATNAANSETAAAGSASSASASATAAALSLDEFTDIYLGAKASDPTVDNDGNALQLGALYARTTAPKGLKVWDGSAWLTAGLSITSAGAISVTPTGGIAATNVQAALAELDAEKYSPGAATVWTNANLVPDALVRGYFLSESVSGELDWDHPSNTVPGVGPTLLMGNAAHGPGPESYFHALNIGYSTSGDDGNVTQIAIPYGYSPVEMYFRGRYSGGWSPWRRMWTSQNFDPASKQDALGYAPANRAGDTFSGLVNLGYGAIVSPGPSSVSASGQAGCAARLTNTGGQNYGRVVELQTNGNDGPFAVFARGGTAPTNWQLGIAHYADSADFYLGVVDNAFGGRQFRFAQDGRFTSAGPVSAPRTYASDWHRSTGASGWFNETYAGGIYMVDFTWVRTYGGKDLMASGAVVCAGDGTGSGSKRLAMWNGSRRFDWRMDGVNVYLEAVTDGYDVLTIDNNGNVTARGNVTAFSDEDVKKNWRGFGDGFIDRLSQIKYGIYDRIDADLTQVGVSAQSLRGVMPHAVQEDAQGRLSVAYGNAALASVIELAKEVVELRRRVEALEAA